MTKRPREAPAPPAAGGLGSLGELLRARGFEASTAEAAEQEAPPARPEPEPEPATAASLELSGSGKLVVRREKKGHGGHTATVVRGLALGPAELDLLAQQLRKALGCGAHVEADAIVVRGELVERVRAWLAERGARRIVTG